MASFENSMQFLLEQKIPRLMIQLIFFFSQEKKIFNNQNSYQNIKIAFIFAFLINLFILFYLALFIIVLLQCNHDFVFVLYNQFQYLSMKVFKELSQQMYLQENDSEKSSLNQKEISKSEINSLNFEKKNRFQKFQMRNNIRNYAFFKIFLIFLVTAFFVFQIYSQLSELNKDKLTSESTLHQIVNIRQSSQNSKVDGSIQSTVQLKQELKPDNLNHLNSIKSLQIDLESIQQVSESRKYLTKNQKNDHHLQDKKNTKNQQKNTSKKVPFNTFLSQQALKSLQQLTVNQNKQQNYNQNQNQNKLFKQSVIIQSQKQYPVSKNVSLESLKEHFSVPPYMRNFLSPGNHGINSQQVSQAKQFLKLKNQQGQNMIGKKERAYYQEKYRIFQYETQLPICVVIPSYNNIQNDRYKLNMMSILQQEYRNFHIVFIDDGSTDQTYQKTQELLIEKRFPRNRVRMIKNQQQKFAMHNLRRAAMEFCKPEQIFIIVDGDDELIGRQVFKLYNALFQNTGAYFIYTNFLISKKNEIGYSRSIPLDIKQNSSYRSYPYVVSHLRAFYTKLFQLVDQKDLQDQNGQYFRAANDVSISLPILQMSGTKVQYFPQLTYYYNSATGYNNHVLRTAQQRTNDKKVRQKRPYKVISNLFQSKSI